MIFSLICIGYLQLTFSGLKQLILDQSKQNGYQTVPFSVYIHNLVFVFILECSEKSLGTVVILSLIVSCIANVF